MRGDNALLREWRAMFGLFDKFNHKSDQQLIRQVELALQDKRGEGEQQDDW